MTTSVSTPPSTTIVPVVQPVLLPGYGMLQLADAWYPCRIRQGKLTFIPASALDSCPFVCCSTYDEARHFCLEEAALEHGESQPLRNMEQYPDRIIEMEHWLFEQTGRYPCWWLRGTDGISAGVHLDDSVVPTRIAHGNSLYEALITLCSDIEQRQQEAAHREWEAWWQEIPPVR